MLSDVVRVFYLYIGLQHVAPFFLTGAPRRAGGSVRAPAGHRQPAGRKKNKRRGFTNASAGNSTRKETRGVKTERRKPGEMLDSGGERKGQKEEKVRAGSSSGWSAIGFTPREKECPPPHAHLPLNIPDRTRAEPCADPRRGSPLTL